MCSTSRAIFQRCLRRHTGSTVAWKGERERGRGRGRANDYSPLQDDRRGIKACHSFFCQEAYKRNEGTRYRVPSLFFFIYPAVLELDGFLCQLEDGAGDYAED